MTRNEAIQVLNMVEAHGSLVIKAKDMAIKALEQEPILGKIREELLLMEGMEDAVEVIDKYRQEG